MKARLASARVKRNCTQGVNSGARQTQTWASIGPVFSGAHENFDSQQTLMQGSF